jgi:hypothetical protein
MGAVKRRIALSVVGVAALAFGVPSAHGGRDSAPIARIACAETATGPCSESGSIALPAKSFGTQSTDTVPDSSTKAVTTVGISNTDAADVNAFDETWVTVVDAFPKLSTIKSKLVRRVITCALFARGATDNHYQSDGSTSEQVNGTADAYYQLLLAVCVQVAIGGQEHLFAAARAAAASTGCSTGLVSVSVGLQRTASGYRAVLPAKPHRASSRPPLAVSCSPSGTGMQITLKPRSAGTKLRQVIGPHLSLGFSNPSSRPLAIHTSFTFS